MLVMIIQYFTWSLITRGPLTYKSGIPLTQISNCKTYQELLGMEVAAKIITGSSKKSLKLLFMTMNLCKVKLKEHISK